MGLVALKLLSSGEPEYRAPRLTSVVHRRHRRGLFLFRHFGDEGLGSDEERGDRGRVLQRGTHDLGRVDHTGLDEILVLAGRCVEAPVVRSEEHTSELQSLMRISYYVFCLKK